jgi:DNA-directed RNA polymerase subunit RPC12/RpoP
MEETNKYKCINCKKKYTKATSLEKHQILCDYKLKTEREKKIETEENEDIPDYIQLVKLVQELTIKCNKLESKVEQMQKWVDRKKKKINVIEWLNNNINAFVSYAEWVNTNIEIIPEHFEYLMEYNLYQTLEHIIQYNFSEEYIYPIRCFSEKSIIFYVAEKKEDGSTIWKKAQHEDIVLLFRKIYNKMLYELTKWKKENECKFDDSPKLCEKFQKAVIKLMNISFHQDSVFSRMRNVLFNYIKTDLKSVIEYDLEF